MTVAYFPDGRKPSKKLIVKKIPRKVEKTNLPESGFSVAQLCGSVVLLLGMVALRRPILRLRLKNVIKIFSKPKFLKRPSVKSFDLRESVIVLLDRPRQDTGPV